MSATRTKPSVFEIHAVINKVNLIDVPIMSTDRSIPRKEQAALARKLLKSLGIQGVSVTTPNYSMAHSVDVDVPRRNDYSVYESPGFVDYRNGPASRANSAARRKVEDILMAAFPNHGDRSDSMSDYFDFKWSFS